MSLSGSLNLLDTFTLVVLPPAVNMTGSIVPTRSGALLGAELTVTPMVCCGGQASPSLAVTVTVAPPTAFGVIVTTALDTLTVALVVSDDTAV